MVLRHFMYGEGNSSLSTMGYTTFFTGRFSVDRPLDDATFEFLRKLNDTRRMKRSLPEEFGVDGELYVDGGGDCGQDEEDSIVDYNEPPSTQPSLWCGWKPTEDRIHIEWDGAEKFYGYVEWIEWIIVKILRPRNYQLNGTVEWSGEDQSDTGVIYIEHNNVSAEANDDEDDDDAEDDTK